MNDISVIICTRNPRVEYLRRVLESLREQTLEKGNWELLIVDNASDRQVADEWNLSWHPRVRHVREGTVGLMPARLRGIAESYGGLLVFVDDDTPLDIDYLSRARSIWARHPHLGVFGAGTLEPEFEVAPPAELLPYVSLLGMRTVSTNIWSNNAKDISCRPFGGGLCVTQGVAKAYQRLVDRLGVSDVVGRHGQRLFSGDDDLFSWAAADVGKEFGLFPELRVTHLISAHRLVHDYFVRLVHDHTFSHSVLCHLLSGVTPQRLSLSNRLRLLMHRLKNGRSSMQCRFAELLGEDSASRFIQERQLRPLQEPSQVLSTDRTSGGSSEEGLGS